MEIKKIRESRGMLQYELANRMGVKQASVSAWESGKAMPSAENLLKLADILECTVDAILGRDSA
ncbi:MULTISPECIES: helix-turn-helix domain-containing protein [Oscillospiraceae]|jgi:transcriptional regulator, cro/CI family|uniref:helix-turn-helix domain-containing protein n=1 Tax=Oscillospiraceae TaxID=216572 RepID=UPI00258E8BC4|nr:MULTISPECIES: helix-turn-helix transcriptional regulator [Oscillospiraceae]